MLSRIVTERDKTQRHLIFTFEAEMGLAGRKTKQRIGADPRNLAWSESISQNCIYFRCLGAAQPPSVISIQPSSALMLFAVQGCRTHDRRPDAQHGILMTT